MIAMSRCGAICLMVGGPTPQGRGHTDAPAHHDDDDHDDDDGDDDDDDDDDDD